MRYDIMFIGAALICLLVGEGFGIWMGVHQDFVLAPSHAHLNLVGWVTLTAYGLVHRAYPALAGSRLAPYQCALAILGATGLPIGIGMAIASGDTNVLPAIIFSFVVLTATLLFALMFFRKAAFAKAAPA
jgi:hypothetical protein